MTPLMDLSVDVRRASQHLSARREYPTPADGHLRLAFKRPIEVALEEFREARRDRNEPTLRRSSSLDQHHLELARFAQSLCKYTSRRPCANDNHIVHVSARDTSWQISEVHLLHIEEVAIAVGWCTTKREPVSGWLSKQAYRKATGINNFLSVFRC
jgi:hypothetical protein